jgi:signal transduction histidine kinase
MTTIIHISHNLAAQNEVRDALGTTYQLVSVSDAPTAIQYSAMIRPSLILIGGELPGLADLIQRLKMFMPQTPILVLAEPAVTVTGADSLVYRPFTNHELCQNIQLLLAKFAPPLPVTSPPEQQIEALTQANQRLASLNTISALIGTSLDLDYLTDEILDQIHKSVDFDSATLFLLKGKVLEGAASRGLTEFRRGLNSFPKNDRNSAWHVVKNKLPMIINDVTTSDFWEPRPELRQVRSWLGVPLINHDRVVGVLTLDKNQTNAFTQSDARYIFTLAFQIAVAVENIQLFEALEDQATRLKLINEINQELTTILDVDTVYKSLARAIVNRLHYERVTIFTVKPERSVLELRVCHYNESIDAPSSGPDNFEVPMAGTLLENVVRTGRPIIFNQVADGWPAFLGMSVRSALVVPIFVDSQTEAVISVDSRNPSQFKDHDLWTLGSLAIHAAAIIENARLYQDVDSYSTRLQRAVLARTQRLDAIKKISQVISQGVSVDDLLLVVGERINQIFIESTGRPVQVGVALVTGSQLAVQVIYGTATEDSDLGRIAASLHLDPRSTVGQVMTQSQPQLVHNVAIASVFEQRIGNQTGDENSLMIVPLITAGKSIGVIMVYAGQRQAFDEEDLEILETLAIQVASAIESARLMRKTREMAIIEERTRLARDMHDGVAQNLAYLLLQVDRGLNMVEPGSRLEQQLEAVAALLEKNINELRRNIFDLRPVDLDKKSLFDVLGTFVKEFGQRWNMKTSCQIYDHAENVSPDVGRIIYRILQEALSNARKHARCHQVDVQLAIEGGTSLVLTIEDDGRGFDLSQAQVQNLGLGLTSMRERAESVGGNLKISSLPGKGARIRAELPLS